MMWINAIADEETGEIDGEDDAVLAFLVSEFSAAVLATAPCLAENSLYKVCNKVKTWAGSRVEDQAVKPAISANRTVASGKKSAIGCKSSSSLELWRNDFKRNFPDKKLAAA